MKQVVKLRQDAGALKYELFCANTRRSMLEVLKKYDFVTKLKVLSWIEDPAKKDAYSLGLNATGRSVRDISCQLVNSWTKGDEKNKTIVLHDAICDLMEIKAYTNDVKEHIYEIQGTEAMNEFMPRMMVSKKA